ncbi:MAG: DUF2075 domain-containing protein [Rhodospirillales bacterium]|nr:DUF2075 domain-containing protein [Rhodospirillales bacterium]
MRVADFLEMSPEAVVGRLAAAEIQTFRRSEPQQLRAWHATVALLHRALAGWPDAAAWTLHLEFRLRRLGRRLDAALVTPRGVFVLEVKAGSTRAEPADLRQVEDYALDLQDFHAGSRGFPIIPILLPTEAQREATPIAMPLLLAGATPPLAVGAGELGPLLRRLWALLPVPATPLDVAAWPEAPYRPVPGIVEAARRLYASHGVEELAEALADRAALAATQEAIGATVRDSLAGGRKAVVFVTGIPGAGKTLCGLETVFGTGRAAGAAFLTGNPTLVHVFREALARDAVAGGMAPRDARQRMEGAIQALPRFRDAHVRAGGAPPERVIVIDEAQRLWNRAHAVRKSRDREVALTDAEPALLLDIMARHAGGGVIVCLVGSGQEIHDGEGGLGEWAEALRARPAWRVLAAETPDHADARRILPATLPAERDPRLHLAVARRTLRAPALPEWVDLVLDGDAGRASRLAASGAIPIFLTRDLAALRSALRARARARGLRRSGLVASSGAKRLRAEGLGVELPHMDAGAVARWFLDRWPDVRASDALETVATEFSCQGLELDYVGLCWGGDLVRGPRGWRVRRFAGTSWQRVAAAEAAANRVNTYRVLLTRARYETIVWVPRGDRADATREPAELDAIADFLRAAGARDLTPPAAAPAMDTHAAVLL